MSGTYIEEVGDIYEANILEEGESAGKQDQLEQNTSDLHNSGPEAAENFEPADESEDGHAKKLTQAAKKDKKPVKKESIEINNSTMKDTKQQTNKSTFDRLFEDVMGGDLDLELGGGDDDAGLEGDPGLGDDEEGLDTITLDLPRDVAEQLHTALGDLLGGGESVDDIEDVPGEEGGDEFESMESHVELNAAPDSVSQLTGMNNKAGLSPDGGSADASASGQVDGGEPKAAADGKGKLQGKSNKVADLKGNAFSH